MGAFDDTRKLHAATRDEALAEAARLIEQACYEHGHGGYTGTIAEARGVKVASARPHTEARAHDLLFGSYDPETGAEITPGRCSKYGPAYLVKLDDGDAWLLGCRAAS